MSCWSSEPTAAELAEVVASEAITLALHEEAQEHARPQTLLVIGARGVGKSSFCTEALNLYGCSPGVINALWDVEVKVVVRVRLSRDAAESLVSDGEPLRLRRVFAQSVSIDVSRVLVAVHHGPPPHRLLGFEITVRPDYESPISAAEAADQLCRELASENSDLNVALSSMTGGDAVIETRHVPERHILGLRQLPNGNFSEPVRAPGVEESALLYEGRAYRLIDVCGQNERVERSADGAYRQRVSFKRWARVFDQVTAVLCVCDIGDYEQLGKIDEQLAYVRRVCNQGHFAPQRDARGYQRHVPVHVLLTKVDRFRDSLPNAPLASACAAFADYRGANTFADAAAFVKRTFSERVLDDAGRAAHGEVHAHLVDATDSSSVKAALLALFAHIRQAVFRPA